MEKIAQQFITAIIKFILYLILVLALLSIIGIQISGIITALSALILAVGMALESNIANLANGIVIVATHMFKKGDFISVDGKDGSIVDINFLFTTIMTPDNKKVTIPNSTIVNNSVVNAGANKTRRVDFTFSVAYETDVELVKKIVIEVMTSDGRVIVNEEHTPFCRLKTLGSSSIDFFANCWCDKEDYWDVYYYVVENVYNEFKRNGISIPYSQLEVRNRTDNVVMPVIEAKLQDRVEKERKEEENFDLETADLTQIFKAAKTNKKESKKAKKEEKKSNKK
jgi:small conductance mechanosensitive channel